MNGLRYILEQFVPFRLAGEDDVAALILELEQYLRQAVVELEGRVKETRQKINEWM